MLSKVVINKVLAILLLLFTGISFTYSQLPSINCPPDLSVGNDFNTCSAVIDYTTPTCDSNCAGVQVVLVSGIPSGFPFNVGTTVVTYRAFNQTSSVECSFLVTVVDTQAPMLVCPSDTTLFVDSGECEALFIYDTPVGIDNCDAITSQIAGFGSGLFPTGITTEAFEAVDTSGNKVTCSFDITVIETAPPLLVCPADIIILTDSGNCTAVVNYVPPNGIDDCSGIPATTLISGLGTGAAFPTGTSTEVYEAIDASGNVATCSFNITVIDSQPPVIMGPVDFSANNDPGQCGARLSYQAPIAFDNCSGVTLTQTMGLGSGQFFPVGTTREEYKATDQTGNEFTFYFDITVIDVEPPTLTGPTDITVDNDPGSCGAVVNYSLPVADDNCPGSTSLILANGNGSGGNFRVGSTFEAYVATDQDGNTATHSFIITVLDAEAPVIDCPSDVSIIADSNCEATYSIIPNFQDNCTPRPSISSNPPIPATFTGSGDYPIVYTATDVNGNTSTCSHTITVISPIIVDAGPDQSVLFSSGGGPSPLPCVSINVTASGGNPPFTYQWSPAVGLSNSGIANPDACPTVTTTYTVEVTDANGCVGSDEVVINAYDLSDDDALPTYGNNPNRIIICHVSDCSEPMNVNKNGNCNSPNSLCHHLMHGDYIGPCTSNTPPCPPATAPKSSISSVVYDSDNSGYLSAYPNPFHQNLTIEFRISEDSKVKLDVFSITGKHIASLFDGNAESAQDYKIDFGAEKMAEGIYIIKLQTKDNQFISRVVLAAN